jgi:hypothetical protein
MTIQYNTIKLIIEQKVEILHRAKAVCSHWWVDILDCSKSYRRQQIDMPFEEIMSKFDGRAISVIHRNLPPENFLEIGFRTSTDPEYFLWLILDTKYIPEFTEICK